MAKAGEKKLHFVENFGLSGAAAIISKTAAAPIERVKLLVQNQDEMLKQGRLETPYKGVIDCTARTYKAEGFASFWRGMEWYFFCFLEEDLRICRIGHFGVQNCGTLRGKCSIARFPNSRKTDLFSCWIAEYLNFPRTPFFIPSE